MTIEYPDYFARFYDLIYDQMRDKTDHTFFLDEIKSTRGSVLEIGTGTGRFFSDALKQGADIYGIDISSSMLDVLKQKIGKEEHHRISVQNMIDFKFDFKFDLIIAPFRVMMHLIDKSDQLNAINNVYRYLRPGGKFIFDVFKPDLKLLLNGLKNVKDFEAEYEPGKQFRRYTSTKSDLVNQVTMVTFNFKWDEETGTRSEEWSFPFRFFFRYELEHLVERSDFENYKILGDFHGGELSEDSKEFIVVCDKT